jgi:hypothetical protein
VGTALPGKAGDKELVLSMKNDAWHKKTTPGRCRATSIPVSRKSSQQSTRSMR